MTERRSFNIDALRLLIICLIFFCCLVMICVSVLGYLLPGGRTFFSYISAAKEMILVALGILGGAVTGTHMGNAERRKPPEEPKP